MHGPLGSSGIAVCDDVDSFLSYYLLQLINDFPMNSIAVGDLRFVPTILEVSPVRFAKNTRLRNEALSHGSHIICERCGIQLSI